MKILWKKLGEKKIKILVDSLDDLWYLSNILEAGNTVYSRTMRTVDIGGKEKKPVSVQLEIKKTEFDRTVNRLRILGIIKAGKPEEYISLGAHHSINLEPGSELVIQKDWRKYELEILKNAERKRPKIILIAVDREGADIGLLKEYGIEYQSMRARTVGKEAGDKEREALETKFFHQIARVLESYNFERCILCGAGFWKDSFFEFLKLKYPEMHKKCLLQNTSSYGKNAISELLKKGIVNKLVWESKVAEEVLLVNKLLGEMGKDGKYTYGFENVRTAQQYNAIDKLLITDKMLREKTYIDELLRDIEKSGGKVHIISTEHEAGKQLQSLGGIAALLRIKIE